MPYAEQRFRHRQDGTCHVGAHPKWGGRLLGKSKSTMSKYGCVVSCTAYMLSRFYGKEVTPGDWLTWLNNHNGFVGDLLIWNKVNEYTKGKLVYSLTKSSYTLLNVWVMGAGRVMISHWVVELAGGYMFDPLDGNIKPITAYLPVFSAPNKINQRYYKKV